MSYPELLTVLPQVHRFREALQDLRRVLVAEEADFAHDVERDGGDVSEDFVSSFVRDDLSFLSDVEDQMNRRFIQTDLSVDTKNEDDGPFTVDEAEALLDEVCLYADPDYFGPDDKLVLNRPHLLILPTPDGPRLYAGMTKCVPGRDYADVSYFRLVPGTHNGGASINFIPISP